MLANWMLYCAAVGVLLSGGAVALERGMRSLGRPTRWVWAGAMALTLAVPAAARLAPASSAAPVAVSVELSAERTRSAPAPAAAAAKTRARWPAVPALDLGGWDPALRLAWGASSAAVLLGLAAMAAVLARRRRGWSAAEVDGVPVLVSSDVGPAVVGLFRSRIVLPAWALAADEEARRLVVAHEREHVRAGDPRLLAAAIVFAALTPWNPAAWWQLRRLRLAIEVDCDARVLRRRADVRAYGAALLEVGRRASRSRLATAAFAEPVSSLERRIRIMTAPRVRRPLLRAAAFGALAAALVVAACEAPQPTQPSSRGPSFAKTELTPKNAVAQYFPEVATKGTGADDILLFVVTPEGEVLRHSWIRDAPDPTVPVRGAGDPRLRPLMEPFRGKVQRVQLVEFREGEVGPTPTRVIWARLRPVPGSSSADSPGVLQLADVDELPEIVNREAIGRQLEVGYPPLLRDAGVEGIVTVSMVVGADGLTRVPTVVHTDDEAFRAPALAAVARMRFRPAKRGGRAVAVQVTLPMAFQLSRSAVGPASADAGGSEHAVALRDAVRRHYPPLMRDAGVTARVAVSFAVGADGKARGVSVVDTDVAPAFAQAARAVVADLTFPPAGADEETVMLIPFLPERTPAPSGR